MEIDAILGSVIELGQLLGHKTPHMDSVYACVKLLNNAITKEKVAFKPVPVWILIVH